MVVKVEMAGTILEMKVKVGDSVKKGQDLCILESMKMEVPVVAPADGKITVVHKNVGQFVNEGEGILEMA